MHRFSFGRVKANVTPAGSRPSFRMLLRAVSRAPSLALLLAGPITLMALADPWPAWRGPEGTGIATEKHLPLHWSTTSNVRWRTPLPEPGNSTPIVWNDRVFVTQAIESRRALLCYNR